MFLYGVDVAGLGLFHVNLNVILLLSVFTGTG